jgi:hypothetical protein
MAEHPLAVHHHPPSQLTMLKVTDCERTCEALISDDLIPKVGVFKEMMEVLKDGGDDPVLPHFF